MNRILALLLLVLSFAGAQGLKSIIINPNPPADLRVQVWVDKDPSGTGNPVYQFGEYIRISVQVTQDAYVYLFSVRATGEITGILPNAFEQDNFTRGGEIRTFPSPSAQYAFQIDPPAGQDRVLAVASRQPLDISQIIDIQNGQGRIQGADNLARSLSIVVTPIPSQDWVSDEAYYIAGNYTPPPPPPVTGNLVVNSNVAGAQALINGQVVGNIPLNITLNPGTYTLEVRRAGYNPYRASVSIQAGRTTQIYAQLVPTPPPTGTLVVNSNVGGAEVLVNGRRVGNAPVTLSLNAGNYVLEVRRAGYNPYRANVNIQAGRTTQIYANLGAIPRPQPQPQPVPVPVPSPSGAITYTCSGGRLVVNYVNNSLVRVFYDDAFQELPLVSGGTYSDGTYTWQLPGTFSVRGQVVRSNCRQQ